MFVKKINIVKKIQLPIFLDINTKINGLTSQQSVPFFGLNWYSNFLLMSKKINIIVKG